CRERLVDFDEVEGLERQLDPVEEPLHALDRGEEQPLRRDLGLGVADDPGKRLETEPFDGPLAHDDRRGRTVRDPRGVAGGHGPGRGVAAVLACWQVEDGFQPCQRLRAGVPSRPVTGASSSANRPSSIAAIARWCDVSANASWSSRLTESWMATRSACVPMW